MFFICKERNTRPQNISGSWIEAMDGSRHTHDALTEGGSGRAGSARCSSTGCCAPGTHSRLFPSPLLPWLLLLGLAAACLADAEDEADAAVRFALKVGRVAPIHLAWAALAAATSSCTATSTAAATSCTRPDSCRQAEIKGRTCTCKFRQKDRKASQQEEGQGHLGFIQHKRFRPACSRLDWQGSNCIQAVTKHMPHSPTS